MPTHGVIARGSPAFLLAVGLVSLDSAEAVPPPVVQYGAECAAPTFATDVLVCGDEELRLLDAEVLKLFEQLRLETPGDEPQLEADQWEWFRRRSECAFQADHRQCVLVAYHGRLAELRPRRAE